MLALTLLPIACVAFSSLTCRISGGLFQDFAPSAYHMQHVLLPTLRRMGVQAELKILRPGSVPTGDGVIEVKVIPVEDRLTALQVVERGSIVRIEGIALSSHLKDRKVSERMAAECRRILRLACSAGGVRRPLDHRVPAPPAGR